MKYQSVLIIEDTKSWQDIFEESLLAKGYQVKVTDTYLDAIKVLNRQYFDVAVVDIRLSEGDITNTDGMKVLKEIRDIGDPTSIVIVSGYATVGLTREAFKRYEVLDFIEKDQFKESEFVQLVERGVQDALSVGYEKETLSKKLLPELGLSQSHLLPGSLSERNELLQEMFVDFLPLAITPPTKSRLVETSEGKNVIQIVGWSRRIGEAFVARIGSRDVIQKESRNYNQYVKGILPRERYTSKIEPFYKSNLGGLVYILKGAQLELLRDFTTFYNENTDGVISVIDKLFREVCVPLYSSTGIDIVKVDLSSVYGSMIEQVAAYREQDLQEEDYYLQQMEDDDRQSYLKSRDHQINIDPIEFVEKQSFVFNSPVGVVHGDLHNGNIVLDPHGQSWLVGFYDTGLSDVMLSGNLKADSVEFRAYQSGKRNLLHDFATMEVSIRKTLLLHLDITREGWEEFDLALCISKDLGELVAFKTDLSFPKLEKAFKIIARLRELANEIINYNIDMQLYYSELLFQFLLAYLSMPDSSAKEQLLASASVLAKRLDQWD